MKILISGASGFIGSHLKDYLEKRDHQAVPLVRDKEEEGIFWKPSKEKAEVDALEGYDAVVNLSGENIASGYWTEKKKRKIHDSRVKSTKVLTDALAQLKNPPKVLVNASAVGYYGDRGDEKLSEESPPGSTFLAGVCCDWERQANKAPMRTVVLRFGIVLSKDGGVLKKMLVPFKLGFGGVIGSGEQYMSWIAIEDLLRVIEFAIANEKVRGAVNAVSPNPVTNREFTKILGKVLNRPTVLPLPAFAVRLLFGEMGDELLLGSVRALPKHLQSLGFKFNYPDLESTLKKS